MLKEICSPKQIVNSHQDPLHSDTTASTTSATSATDNSQNISMSNPPNNSEYFPPNSSQSPLPSPGSIRNYDFTCRELHGQLGSKLRLESITPRISTGSNSSNHSTGNSPTSLSTEKSISSNACNACNAQFLPTPTNTDPNSHPSPNIASSNQSQRSQWERRKTEFQLSSDFKLQTQTIPSSDLRTNLPQKNPYNAEYDILDPALNEKRRRTTGDPRKLYQRYSLSLQQQQHLSPSSARLSPSTPTTPTASTYQHHNHHHHEQHSSSNSSLSASAANLQLRSPIEDSSLLLECSFNKEDVTELMKEMFSLNHREANKQCDIEITNKHTENVLSLVSNDKLNSLNHMKITQWYCCQCGKSYGDLNHFSIDEDEKKSLLQCYNEDSLSTATTAMTTTTTTTTTGDNQRRTSNSSDSSMSSAATSTKMETDDTDSEEDLIVMDIDGSDSSLINNANTANRNTTNKNNKNDESFYEFAVDKLLNDAINRFDCLRCHHMMCPYCIKARLSDVINRNSRSN